jgi:CheY-like chemotaxis protein
VETGAAKKRILVVDDSEDIREFYQLILEGAGYDVECAASGEEGFDKARRLRPDLALLDVVMPGMDGLELLLKLRSDLAPPVPPVILCSGFDLGEDEALRRGALMFVRKPVAPEHLLAYIARALGGERAAAEMTASSRSFAAAARRRATAAAAEMVRSFEENSHISTEQLRAIMHEHLQWLARYFGLATALCALMRDDKLVIEELAGTGTLRPGDDLSAVLPACREVLATGSSLVLADAGHHPCFATAASQGVRFFAGVPLHTAERVAVGVVCLFDPDARQFCADDLVMLEQFGRRGSALLDLVARGCYDRDVPGMLGPGLLSGTSFALLVDAETRILRRRGGSLEIAVVELGDLGAARRTLLAVPDPRRLAATALGPVRIGIFARDDGDAAAARLGELLVALDHDTHVSAAGATGVAGEGLPALLGRDLLHLAEVTLDRALECGGGAQRLALQHERIGPEALATI